MKNLKKVIALFASLVIISSCTNAKKNYIKTNSDQSNRPVEEVEQWQIKKSDDKKNINEVSVKEQEVDDIAVMAKPAPSVVGKIKSNFYAKVPSKVRRGVVESQSINEPEYKVQKQDSNTEEYDSITENLFLETIKNPLSTFSIDVDTASYSNIRRYINNKQLPPKDSVRIEEMINYFTYNYPNPESDNPFSVNLEMTDSPWNNQNKVVKIGIQGKKISTKKMPPANIVFLIDTSGSMEDENKLPLLKSAYKLLVEQLREEDKVSIVAYAGSAGVILEPTSAINKQKIIDALDNLQAGGSTAGGEGIALAYKLAGENLMKNGNNRVILATDGDFNVGVSSDGELVRIIEQEREKGVFLSVLGFGMGNYKDSKMEQLADKGNGNYAYIDSLKEAKKVFVSQLGGTLLTIAKDVKLQLEFNPTKVKAYRLIGYENRALKNEDFNDDKKDAGDLGAGHTVTALYEVVPVGVSSKYIKDVDELKYQEVNKTVKANSDELLTVKLRYKKPKESKSQLISKILKNDSKKASSDLRFAMAVAEMGLIMRDSEFKGNANIEEVLTLANNSNNGDYRKEFIQLVNEYEKMTKY